MIDFWFSVGSTYTYLTVMRLADVEQATGITFRWRPFSVRQIMIEMDNIPFRTKPVKAAHMWRDIERRAAMYGLPARVPASYPLKEWDVANRVAVLGAAEGWAAEYARATYRRWFVDGLEPGSEPNLSDSLAEIGQDPVRVLTLAAASKTASAYEAATNEARGLGIFGSPSFIVDRELFWGDDRLNDAITWYRRGTLAP
ncbi:MAG TPA: 2-hydroxychromene-2-carboxylate isomerase [Stellaceae bacterium]|nr:2-hydroxychromene-2-carboxylate isomerase [Stellaceae bacterium]